MVSRYSVAVAEQFQDHQHKQIKNQDFQVSKNAQSAWKVESKQIKVKGRKPVQENK